MKSSKIPLLQEVLEAHGGLGNWRKYRGLESTIVTGGQLWDIKGVEMARSPRRVTTEFQRQWTHITPVEAPDWATTWTPEHVEITGSAGNVIAARDHGRTMFDRSFDAPWDPLNLAYFNGYALWTYHAAPFVLADPGYEIREIAPVEHAGKMLRGMAVSFPDRIHTHSREQAFYFDAQGLLRRHDYSVDVWADAKAAHFIDDYVEVEGLKLPTRRSVFARRPDGTPDPDRNTVTIALSDYRFI